MPPQETAAPHLHPATEPESSIGLLCGFVTGLIFMRLRRRTPLEAPALVALVSGSGVRRAEVGGVPLKAPAMPPQRFSGSSARMCTNETRGGLARQRPPTSHAILVNRAT